MVTNESVVVQFDGREVHVVSGALSAEDLFDLRAFFCGMEPTGPLQVQVTEFGTTVLAPGDTVATDIATLDVGERLNCTDSMVDLIHRVDVLERRLIKASEAGWELVAPFDGPSGLFHRSEIGYYPN